MFPLPLPRQIKVHGLVTYIIGERAKRAKRARHYQGCKFKLVLYMYGGTCAIIVAHAKHT